MPPDTLVIRNAQIEGVAGQDVLIRDGCIAECGPRLAARGVEIDARGGALIPGLVDHHIHLLATAARANSVVVDDVRNPAGFAERVRAGVAAREPGAWLRVTGYHERMAGLLSRAELDALAPTHPVRVQHQTGALWILNSLALALVAQDEVADCVERDADGAPTGRIWRGDAWLRERLGRETPPLAPVGAALVAAGVTGAMDASVTTDDEAADTLAAAVRVRDLPLRLALMSGGVLQSSPDDAFVVGPVKILLDDRDLPPIDEIIGRIAFARSCGRRVAVHCVTAAELALTLAAFETAGAVRGDRIEHGGMIAPDAIPVLASLGLTVVTQPGFVFERGERYLAEVDAREHADLYRCASLLGVGIPVAGSSDAPYSSLDPWSAMRAAVRRRTRDGAEIGPEERVTPAVALALFTGGGLDSPGELRRRMTPGATADLCLLNAPMAEALDTLSAELVAATIVGGRVVYAQG